MTKQERIKLDRTSLINQGYKKIKLINTFDYYNDYETSVTVYRAKIGKETHFKYFYPIELEPNKVWEQIKTGIQETILSYHMDFNTNGLVFNALIEQDNKKKVLLINYSPTDSEVIKKVAEFDGKP